ncbi:MULTISPECIES: magnesium and cobalt transport protein CorA [Streptomyces]|uniref:Magnesium and cobalt transport protein CorA n=2 Tax=Streptomyces viridosporus TaxID=67581 RepID=A0ABX6AIB7_STRVD|nr:MULTISPECIES: magnesium and cobalt transport protein CorA [Streptomyces]PWJ08657.1 magnesium and cobalt transport protein CorA [Streptomyces sp. NWU49]QEU87614.1 magnesium and cobalt transport protein CorA [Streptomyces viridosporus T7A]
MSMIRDLRAVVRPSSRVSLRKENGPYDIPRDPATTTAVVDCAVYRDGRRLETEGPLGPQEAMRLVRRDGGFVWIGLHEPTEAEFAGIAREFGLHPLAVEDAVQAHQRPKLERYDDSLFTVFKTIHYLDHDRSGSSSEVIETGEVMCFTGRDFFITVRHGGQGSLRALRHRLQDDPELLSKGPSAVLHAIADHVVDGYLAVADAVQDDIDEVETEVFSPGRKGTPRGTDAGRIYQLKREVLEFKRAVAPLLRPMQLLSERPMRLIDPEIQKYFRDVADHVARVQEQVIGFDELLNSILQANLAQASVAQNEDMRKITSWAAIIAVPTMVCGVYGMNFTYMPETDWKYGYPLVLGITVAICLGIHRTLKRNGWL